MNKERQIAKSIKENIGNPNNRIIVLTGARQVGKTTIVNDYFQDFEYLAADNPLESAALKQMGTEQWYLQYPKAALDEVQKEPELINYVKAVYDRHKDTQYILLGSSQLLLLSKVNETLAGRCSVYEIFPMTLPEIESGKTALHKSIWQQLLEGKNPTVAPNMLMDKGYAYKKQAYDYYLKFGGYPALVNEQLSDEDRFQWLENYSRTYLERDLRDMADIRSLTPFIKLQTATALNTGQTLVVSNLANDLNISAKTINRYLEYLNISYQTVTLNAWDKNKQKRLMKAPKVHFLDHGVLQAVLRRRGGMSGNEYESCIVAEIYKQGKAVDIPASFYHLRTNDGREVDLLVETPQGYYAFEIKMTDHISATHIRHLKQLEQIVKDKPIVRKFVISNDLETKSFEDGITAIHAAHFLG